MNFYAESAFVAFFLTAGIGFLVWLKAKDRAVGRLFGLVSMCIALWVLGCFGESYAAQRWALTFDVILYTGACLAPTLFLHFVLVFSETLDRYRKFLSCNYAIACFFSLLNLVLPLRTWFIHGVPRRFPYRFIADPGPLWYLFAIWYGLPVCFLIYVLLQGVWGAADSHKRHQYQYFLIASTALATAGTMYFALVFTINMPMIDNFFTCIYGMTMAYAILNHRLMDINLIIRKTLVYTTVVATLTCLYLGAITLFARMFENFSGYQTLFSSAAAAGLISFCFQPLRKRVQSFIDKKFFRQYVDREEKLYELSREVITHTTPEAMGGALMHVLDEALHPKGGALFLRSRDGGGFTPVSRIGSSALPERMDEDNELARYFKDHPQPFVRDLSDELGESRSTRLKEEREDAA